MLAPLDPRVFERDLKRALALRALPYIAARTPASRLRGALHVREGAGGLVEVAVPHYWSPYYHDGRGAFGPVRAKYLVWFRNPADDPRGTGHVRFEQWRPLTKEEWDFGLEANEAIGGSIYSMAFMIFKRAVGPAPAHPFFDEGFDDALAECTALAEAECRRFVESYLEGVEEKIVARVTVT